MPRSGGIYVVTAGIPVTTATVISSTVFNNLIADLAAELNLQLTEMELNTTHGASDGSDHGFVDQDVTATGSPNFTDLTLDNDLPITEGGTGASTAAAARTALGINTPDGIIQAWVPGYFTDGSNGGFTNVLSTANTILAGNTYLNPLGYNVCDGTALNDADSTIFNGAGRYLPNLTDSRFLMGATIVGGIGGSSSSAHTHSHTHTGPSHTHAVGTYTVPTHNHKWYESNGITTSDQSYNSAGNATNLARADLKVGDYSCLHYVDSNGQYPLDMWTSNIAIAISGSSAAGGTGATGSDASAASNAENRPLYLSCLYIMKVKTV